MHNSCLVQRERRECAHQAQKRRTPDLPKVGQGVRQHFCKYIIRNTNTLARQLTLGLGAAYWCVAPEDVLDYSSRAIYLLPVLPGGDHGRAPLEGEKGKVEWKVVDITREALAFLGHVGAVGVHVHHGL